MHGTGNDFVVLDAINQSLDLNESQMRFLSDRHFGVGCDQILVVEHALNPDVDFRYRIFNADGGEVEQCGNGARCFARFIREKGLTDKNKIRVETNSGIIILHVDESNEVTVDMGSPRLDPADIPLAIALEAKAYQLELENNDYTFGAVSMGNPHCVMEVESVKDAPVAELGEKLESHACFPQRANIGFMEVINRSHIKLRVYERGAAETLACGTGACAAAVVGQLWGKLDSTVTVTLPGGNLTIKWLGGNSSVFLTGPAAFVFEGEIEIPTSLDNSLAKN